MDTDIRRTHISHPALAFIVQHGEQWLLGILMLVALGLRVYHLRSYPVHEDEFITLSALQSIVRTGLPLIGDGEVYWRALLGHYLMVIPLFFTEPTVYAARLMPTLFSVLLLPVAYLGGRQAAGRLAGWIAAIFLAFSAYQNHHAAFARFYLPFQVFATCAILLAGSYFILRRPGSGKWLFLATLATLATHALSVVVLPVLALAFLVGGRWDLLRSWRFLLLTGVVAVAAYFLVYWRPQNTFENSFALTLVVGGLDDKWAFYGWFKKFVPFGGTLIILGLFPMWVTRCRYWVYLFWAFLFALVLISLVSPDPNPRYMSHLFPLGVILAAASLGWWLREVVLPQLKGRPALRWSRGLLVGMVVAALATTFLGVAENLQIRDAFGNYFRFADQKPAHDFIARLIRPQDVLISLDPGMTAYLLERQPEYWLRERYDPVSGAFRPYDEKAKKGNPDYYLDTPERLLAVLDGTDRRIWLYLNHKIGFTTSPEMRRVLEKRFATVFADPVQETYVLVRY